MSNSFDEDMAEIQAFIAELQEQTHQVNAEIEQDRAAAEEAAAELAKQRRAGALGRDWQTLQGRIDMNLTTEADIINGVDLSSEARAIRALAAANVASVRDDVLEGMSDPAGELSGQLQLIEQAHAEIVRTLHALQQEAEEL